MQLLKFTKTNLEITNSYKSNKSYTQREDIHAKIDDMINIVGCHISTTDQTDFLYQLF